jgi:hypothetical protein
VYDVVAPVVPVWKTMLPLIAKDVAVATPRFGVVSVKDVPSFADVIAPSAIVTVSSAPVSKLSPADKALTNVSIDCQLALCSAAIIGSPLLNVYGMFTVAMIRFL